MQKQWKRWFEVCDNCGAASRVYTAATAPCIAQEGDFGRCTRCYCTGIVQKDHWGYYLEWSQDMCAKCYRDQDARMDRLSKRIYTILHAEA